MTNKEALVAALMVSVSDNSLEKAMIDGGVTSAAQYTLSDAKAIDLCVINVLQSVLSSPNISEGGYSIEHDRPALQARLVQLQQKHGLISTGPKVKAKSVW